MKAWIVFSGLGLTTKENFSKLGSGYHEISCVIKLKRNTMTAESKSELKRKIINSLKSEKEIRKIVLFGSFLSSDSPHDVDIVIFQDSDESYLNLAMKYRKKTRHIAKEIPLDIIPLKAENSPTAFLREIESGEILYERF